MTDYAATINLPGLDDLAERVYALEQIVKAEGEAISENQLALVHPPVSAPSGNDDLTGLDAGIPSDGQTAREEDNGAPVHVPVSDPTTAGGPGGASDAELDAERAAQLAAPPVASDVANQTPPEAPSDATSTVGA